MIWKFLSRLRQDVLLNIAFVVAILIGAAWVWVAVRTLLWR